MPAMTNRKTESNRTNALQSTGPTSAAGKARASLNAQQHGILSSKLLLPNEDANEFTALLQQLQVDLTPVGLLEYAMVERIAIALWRQRRLVSAETATIELQQQSLNGAEYTSVMSLAGLEYSDSDWVHLIARDPPNPAGLQVQMTELDNAFDAGIFDLPAFRKKCPRAWQELAAESELPAGLPVSQQLDFVQDYFSQQGETFENWQSMQGAHLRKLLRVVNALALVRQVAMLPVNSDVLARYQSALDNDVYKASRALRDQQNFRLDQAAINAKPIE